MRILEPLLVEPDPLCLRFIPSGGPKPPGRSLEADISIGYKHMLVAISRDLPETYL
jgi:hypothetical protein